MKRLRFFFLLILLGGIGAFFTVFHPAAEEVDDSEPATVSESDLEMYIKVYTVMQDNHDLTIENALEPHHLSVDSFRDVERRIQAQPRLVDRVRQALLDHAKSHSLFAHALPSPTASPVRALPTPRRSKKK